MAVDEEGDASATCCAWRRRRQTREPHVLGPVQVNGAARTLWTKPSESGLEADVSSTAQLSFLTRSLFDF